MSTADCSGKRRFRGKRRRTSTLCFMKKWTLFYTDAEHPSKLQQAVGELETPTKKQLRQIATPQQKEKPQQLATGRCARIREKRSIRCR